MKSLFKRVRHSLAEFYDVRGVIGTGGMATVFEAWDPLRNQSVAIKVLKPELADGIPRERFRREVTVASKLHQANIVPILASGEEGGIVYYVMPLVSGETLRHRLLRDRIIPVAEAVFIAGEISRALEHAHGHGIMHRDVKPENILLSEGHALVTDFGIARTILDDGSNLTITGTAVGTPTYMSPEQATANRADARTDLYSLGCVLYEMIAGIRPFADLPSPFARKPTDPVAPLSRISEQDVPAGLDDLVGRTLAWTPDERPESAAAMRSALDQIQIAVGSPKPAPSGTRTARGWAGLAIAAAGVLATGLLVSRLVGPGTLDPSTISVEALTFEGPPNAREVATRFSEETVRALSGAVGVGVVTPASRTTANPPVDYVLTWTFLVDTNTVAPSVRIRATIRKPGDTTTVWRSDSVLTAMIAEDLSQASAAIANDIAAAVRDRARPTS